MVSMEVGGGAVVYWLLREVSFLSKLQFSVKVE